MSFGLDNFAVQEMKRRKVESTRTMLPSGELMKVVDNLGVFQLDKLLSDKTESRVRVKKLCRSKFEWWWKFAFRHQCLRSRVCEI